MTRGANLLEWSALDSVTRVFQLYGFSLVQCSDVSVTGFKKSGPGSGFCQVLHLVSSQIGVRVWFRFMLKSRVSVCKK